MSISGDVGRAGPSTRAGAIQDTSENATITHLQQPTPAAMPDQATARVSGLAIRAHTNHD